MATHRADGQGGLLCDTPRYASCAHYAAGRAQALRHLILNNARDVPASHACEPGGLSG